MLATHHNNTPVAMCKASAHQQTKKREMREGERGREKPDPTQSHQQIQQPVYCLSVFTSFFIYSPCNPCSENQIMEKQGHALLFFSLLLQSCRKLVPVTIVYQSAWGKTAFMLLSFKSLFVSSPANRRRSQVAAGRTHIRAWNLH